MSQDLDDAKQSLRTAAAHIDPLRSLRQHPYATVSIALTAGYVIGTNNHSRVIKTVRSGIGVMNSLRPALLAAGKIVGGIVASQYAAHAAAAAEAAGQPTGADAATADGVAPATASA